MWCLKNILYEYQKYNIYTYNLKIHITFTYNKYNKSCVIATLVQNEEIEQKIIIIFIISNSVFV